MTAPLAPPQRAIVVNDDATQRQMLAGLLRKRGLTVQTFAGAEAALEAMQKEGAPDLIVTDIYMPGIDGWRFCRLLRSPDYVFLNAVPILVVSATYSGAEPDQIAHELGANAFLAMPVDGPTFLDMVQTLLQGERSRAAPRALVVEDSQLINYRLQKAFVAHGYQVETAFTLAEARTQILATLFDVVALDYHLPDGEGDTLLKTIQTQQPECVCIMMTADPQPALAPIWMKMGAAAYVHKPFAPEYLIAECERARRERTLLRVEVLLERRTRELRESEGRYRALFEQGPDGMVILDPSNGKLLEFNDQACRQLGYTREEFRQLSVADLEVLESPAAVLAHIHRIVAVGHDDFETKHRTKDGNIRDIHVMARVIQTSPHPVYHCIWRDITARKWAEEQILQLNTELEQRVATRTSELSRANDQLRQAMRAKDEFMASMSHELRTPLTAILGLAELLQLQMYGPLNDRQAYYAQSIYDSGQHLLALINDVLDLAKLASGQTPLHLGQVNVAAICQQAQELVKPQADQKQVSVSLALAPAVQTMVADERRLKQILVNLLGNAIKFTPPEGRAGLMVRGEAQQHRVEFVVWDTGLGIAADDLPRLFQDFVQLDGRLAREYEGTGLGLAIVRRLAELHGGSVKAESEGPGKGSRFTVSLPWEG